MKRYCLKPDRDVPRIICGHPLPCPYHTTVIDTTTSPPHITHAPGRPLEQKLGRKRMRQLTLALTNIPRNKQPNKVQR